MGANLGGKARRHSAFNSLRYGAARLSASEAKPHAYLLALLGMLLVPVFGILYRLWPSEIVDPWWCRLTVAGLYGGLFGLSYASEWVRTHFPVLMWGCFYVMVAWVVALVALNGMAGGYAVGILLVYAIVGVCIGIGADSLGPLLWFLGYGFCLVAGVYAVVPSPGTNPFVLLGSLGTMAIVLYVTFQARLSMRRNLQAAREEAEAASRLKSALLANMSHEVRTPLTSILGFAELIADADPDDPEALAERIRRSGRRLLDTLDSVLQVSRLESGAVELQPESLDVAEVVADRVDSFESMAEQNDVRLGFCRGSGTVEALLDPGATERIVDELVRNAIDFSEAGDRACVSVYGRSEDVTITVEDTGVGMDEESLDELFQPFEQESVGWDRTHEGTELGLTVVHRLTRLMDGSIEVESEKGEGTRVVVTLPRREPAPGGPDREEKASRKPSKMRSDRREEVVTGLRPERRDLTGGTVVESDGEGKRSASLRFAHAPPCSRHALPSRSYPQCAVARLLHDRQRPSGQDSRRGDDHSRRHHRASGGRGHGRRRGSLQTLGQDP